MSTPTATKPITPEDLLEMGSAGKGFELVNGELRELNMSQESSHIAGEVYFAIKLYSLGQRPAWVFPEGSGFCCFPDDPGKVRKPDTSYIALDRLTEIQFRNRGYTRVVPDLVVEVVSPNDLSYDVEEKRDEWLTTGVQVVWIVHPDTRTVHVYYRDGRSTLLREKDTLTVPELLPGFAVPVANLFRLPTQSA